MINSRQPQEGFALLMTLIVVGVVLSVGLAILDLSIKQASLSTNAKESEIAFHAANAGLECAHFWRRQERTDIRTGQDITVECFGDTAVANADDTVPTSSGGGDVYVYQYELTWSGTSQRCTDVVMLTMFSDVTETDPLTITNANLKTVLPGYKGTTDKECAPGEQCTMLAVKGYNRPCSTKTGYGAIQREVLLEF